MLQLLFYGEKGLESVVQLIVRFLIKPLDPEGLRLLENLRLEVRIEDLGLEVASSKLKLELDVKDK